jgi:hypothetical protein
MIRLKPVALRKRTRRLPWRSRPLLVLSIEQFAASQHLHRGVDGTIDWGFGDRLGGRVSAFDASHNGCIPTRRR